MAALRSIRFKLFLLISAVVAAPVVVLSLYFPAAQIAHLEEALAAKSVSFARMVGEQTRSALSFEDVETVREAFASAALDEDVSFLGLYKQGGRPLFVQGESREAAPAPNTTTIVDRRGDRVRAHLAVTSAESYAGVIVVELSTARVAAIGAGVRRTALLVGLGALVVGCIAAWFVGGSFARRIARVTERAKRVAAGDLSTVSIADPATDEIGQLATSFDGMVDNLGGLVKEIDDAAGMIEVSTEIFLDMAKEEEQRGSATDFTGSVVAGLTELGGYAVQLRSVVARFQVAAPVVTPAPEATRSSIEIPTIAGAAS